MLSISSISALGLVVGQVVSAQFVPAPTDLIATIGYLDIPVRYKEVPTGICELDPSVKSYSGYVDIAENEHSFFWFFEARNTDPLEAPLTVWINGGPGSSSMIGLFQENGPCSIDADGNVLSNPYSWSNASNMLFIDNPTQVGFSYSIPINGYVDTNSDLIVTLPSADCPDYAVDFGTCGTYSYPNETLTANSTADAAPRFWRTLQGFMGAFPQYSQNGFVFTTESYGGHYAPIFNEYFETQNAANISGAHKISLESVIIGNGWYDPLIQYQAYYNFTVFPGNTYDYVPFTPSVQDQMYNNMYGPGNCLDQIKDCAARGIDEICEAADNFCYYQVEAIYDTYAGRDEYDVRELTPDPFPYEYYVDYLNTPEVLTAIGAYQNFSESNNAVYYAFTATGDDNREDGTVEALQKLLKQGVAITMYHGDADYNCNWLGGEVVAAEVSAPKWALAGYTNITTSDGIVHGQVKQAGSFSFVRIYESGHEVPFYQPLAALEMFERAVAKVDIATGTIAVAGGGNGTGAYGNGTGYLTVGTQKSTYREGNATVQFEVLPGNATYPPPDSDGSESRKRSLVERRSAKGRSARKSRKMKGKSKKGRRG